MGTAKTRTSHGPACAGGPATLDELAHSKFFVVFAKWALENMSS
jgi:hypothetical protein